MKKYMVSPLLSDIQRRAKKAAHPEETPISTIDQNKEPVITVITFDENNCHVVTGGNINDCLPQQNTPGIIWVNIEGLRNADLIKTAAERFNIHALTVEDILNSDQRPKVEEFDHYIFLTLKMLQWSIKESSLTIQQVSIIFGDGFILSFEESDTTIFNLIRTKLQSTSSQRLRQQNTDYLAYRLMDAIVDEYFVVLESLGEQIEMIEGRIVSSPTPQNSRIIYRLKRQMLLLRKSVWPMREMISHLLYEEDKQISKFTRVYLRDLYDHTMQAIDTIETFREMLSSMLDMYLSVITIRMNEIVKTLTIITTIFIPITALASIYGMNLPDIPLMKSKWGFLIVSFTMISSIISMVLYFRRKKWL